MYYSLQQVADEITQPVPRIPKPIFAITNNMLANDNASWERLCVEAKVNHAAWHTYIDTANPGTFWSLVSLSVLALTSACPRDQMSRKLSVLLCIIS